MTHALRTPEYLQFSDFGHQVHFGCDQDWYPGFWQRKAGCGPCTGSHILYYLARGGRLSLPMEVRDRDSFIHLMEHSWNYLTPGVMGLNSPWMMQAGLDRMLSQLGTGYQSRVLEIPGDERHRPDSLTVEAFIREGLAADSPVAFLNLHNGGIPQLETWHWVTVVGISGSGETAALDIYDNGHRLAVNLPRWLRDTRRGGGFVYVVDSREGAA
ncbi:MAG: hypothetical protein GXY84_08305 [Clostridiales bacterium]|nr:hypothetical protein [Clostridiales bacterium]